MCTNERENTEVHIMKKNGVETVMTEKYKGYIISTGWNEKMMGFDFHVHDNNGTEAFSSGEPYFYEENAMKAAKEAVDEKAGQE